MVRLLLNQKINWKQLIQMTNSFILKECSYLTVRAFFNMIERKRNHEGDIYDKSYIWREN